MGLRMREKSIGVADDRMIERVLLFLYYYRLMFSWFRRRRANEVSDFP